MNFLFAYWTAPHLSAGETPFSLLNGQDPRVPISMDFYTLINCINASCIESQHAKELFIKDLNRLDSLHRSALLRLNRTRSITMIGLVWNLQKCVQI